MTRVFKQTALAAAVVACLTVPSAQAAEVRSGPVTYVTESATAASGTDSSVQAACPAGQVVIGGGGGFDNTSPSPDALDLAAMFPADDPVEEAGSIPNNIYRIELDNSSGVDQRATATTMCVDPTKTTLSYSSETNPVGAGNSSTSKFVSCAAGKTATSGGFEPDTADNQQVEIENLALPFDGDKPQGSGYNISFSKDGPGFSYTNHAICAGDEKVKYAYSSDVLFSGVSTLKAKCPKGTRLVGGGFSNFPADLFFSGPYDSQDKNKAPDDGWKLRVLESSPSVGIAFANCLK